MTFDEACGEFTGACEEAAQWKHTFAGAAYRTRIDAAFRHVERAYRHVVEADAPPHERSEGEQTERLGAVDPYTKGLHAGREEMRERAARLIETTKIVNSNTAEKPYLSPRRPGDTNALPYADAIRSLPLQAEGEDGILLQEEKT